MGKHLHLGEHEKSKEEGRTWHTVPSKTTQQETLPNSAPAHMVATSAHSPQGQTAPQPVPSAVKGACCNLVLQLQTINICLQEQTHTHCSRISVKIQYVRHLLQPKLQEVQAGMAVSELFLSSISR